ncbi:MAG TPA: hypothetical protein VMR73_01770 [Candidatus Paceibacterota bacterium]|nr:hypothetical protein [Candidatus Paceibacterota bacterium]
MVEITVDELEEIYRKEIPNWDKLSDTEKIVKRDKFINIVEKKVSVASNEVTAFKFLLLGVILGIVGNLWASIIYDFFKNYKLPYLVVLILITILIIWRMIRIFRGTINKHMSSDPILRRLWEKMIEKEKL